MPFLDGIVLSYFDLVIKKGQFPAPRSAVYQGAVFSKNTYNLHCAFLGFIVSQSNNILYTTVLQLFVPTVFLRKLKNIF